MQKIYLITGGTSDIGMELLHRLMGKNPEDLFIVQGLKNLQILDGLPAQYQDNIKRYAVDLSAKDAVERFADELLQEYHHITHFIHLPALKMRYSQFKKFDNAMFQNDFSIQFHSAQIICRKIIPAMTRNRYGRLLFMLSSVVIGTPPSNLAEYCVVKNSLQSLAKSLAVEYATKGITVNCVAPSMADTRFLSEIPDLLIEMNQRGNPMKRLATPGDIAPAMEFLISDEASYITGVTLPITGGSTIL